MYNDSTGVTLQIRLYIETDKPQIVALMNEFQSYLLSIDSTDMLAYRAESADFFTNKLLDQVKRKNGAVYVAEDNGNVVGFIGGFIENRTEEDEMELKNKSVGMINEFFVTDSVRGKGVGSNLLKTLEDYFTQQQCAVVKLGAFADNNLARKFYSKNGYKDWSIFQFKKLN